MFKRKALQIRVGDRFIKAGAAGKIWTVMGICEDRHALPHARLASEPPSSDSITISVRALADNALFRPFNPVPVAE